MLRTLIPAIGIVFIGITPVVSNAETTHSVDSTCPVPEATQALNEARYFDAHTLALIGSVVCRDESQRDRLSVVDGIALLALDELNQAHTILSEVLHRHGTASQQAGAVLALDYIRSHNTEALATLSERLPTPVAEGARALRLIDEADTKSVLQILSQTDIAVAERYLDARADKAPWLAAVLSGVLPGLGQVYAGSWQGAAVALLLNSVFIAATVELTRNELYGAAVATGVAGSFFYVGSIINAADLAARQNAAGAAPHWDRLERSLLPDAFPR